MQITMKPRSKTPNKELKPAHKEKKYKQVSAETALRYLKNGNTRFVKRRFRADGRGPLTRVHLIAGEHPHAIVLAGSDSRVVPEIIFDQGLGEIYTVRTFGEALDSAVVASIEYAVEKLETPLLVVLGHSNSAAMQMGMNAADVMSASQDMQKVMSDIPSRLKAVENEAPSTNLEVEATLNADGIARELQHRSKIIRNAVESGRLTIKTALYRQSNGKVSFY